MADKGKTVVRTVPPPLPSPATGSANPASSLQALWPYISPALDHMFTAPAEDEDPARAPAIDVGWYSGIHSNVYNYCTAQSATADSLSGADLYTQLDRYFAATARDVLLAAPAADASPPSALALPRFLGPAFARYNAAARAAGRLLHYLDRHYVKRAVDEDRGWLRAADAFAGAPPPPGLPRAELAARLRAYRLIVLKSWGWDEGEGDAAARALAEAAAEAGSAPDRVVPVNAMALRRFRTEVVDPLLAVPKAKGKKKGKKRPGADPRGRLARAVKALLEPENEEQENVQPAENGQGKAGGGNSTAAQGSSAGMQGSGSASASGSVAAGSSARASGSGSGISASGSSSSSCSNSCIRPAPCSDEERLRLAQDLANMLRLVGVRPDHPLRKKLDGFVRARATAKVYPTSKLTPKLMPVDINGPARGVTWVVANCLDPPGVRFPLNASRRDNHLFSVGAGPTGASLALSLLKSGVSVRLIDKLPQPRVGQKGNGIQPRTIEVLNLLGVIDDFWKRSINLKKLRLYEMPGATKVAKEIALEPVVDPAPDKPWPNLRVMGQDRFEALLFEHLAKHGCGIERGTELRSFTQDADKVTTELVKADGSIEKAEFEFLVGCDGGHSTVRHGLGLAFLGETLHEKPMMLGDIEVKGLDDKYWHMFDSNMGGAANGETAHTYCLFRTSEVPGLATVMAGGENASDKLDTRDGIIEHFLNLTGRKDVEFGELKCASWWRPNIRMVDSLGEGRVFVAGDAAHTHSPTGAQGMNSSIQDGLALVHKKLAPLSLLDTYTSERLPVIAAMLQKTTELYNKTSKAFKEHGAAYAKASDAMWERKSELQQLGVNYRGSDIVLDERNSAKDGVPSAYGSGAGGLRAGDRAPSAPLRGAGVGKLFDVLDSARHTVLVFTVDEGKAKAVVDVVKALPSGVAQTVVIVPQGKTLDISGVQVVEDAEGHAYRTYQVGDEPTTFVVRPDGAIGAIVFEAEGVAGYFAKILGV
ncbi:FAD binding domain-containing protein [Schizophyllum commune]